MELEQATEFADWGRVIFHAEIHIAIVVAAGPTMGPDDQQRRTLLPPPVAAGGLPCFNGREEPFGEFALA